MLTVLGFLVPNAFVVTYFREHGVSPQTVAGFFAEWTSSIPTRALTADLAITSVTFWSWSLWDARKKGVQNWWLVPFGTCSVGICFAAPLYLLLREYAR